MRQRPPPDHARKTMQKKTSSAFRQFVAEVVFGPDAAEGDRCAAGREKIRRAEHERREPARDDRDARPLEQPQEHRQCQQRSESNVCKAGKAERCAAFEVSIALQEKQRVAARALLETDHAPETVLQRLEACYSN